MDEQLLPGAGRYAPTPSGDLHVGNLRTAVIAWVMARSTGRAFRLRIDDLDAARARPGVAEKQIADLLSLGLDFDGPVMWQSQRESAYQDALNLLIQRGAVYECYCSRREILEAPRAPHAPPGAYPGTCRDLDSSERTRRRHALGSGRMPALRLRAQAHEFTITDGLHGCYTAMVDDVVLRRGDGVWAYNLAVVVDDAAQGVDQVVRGDDLLSSTPRQAYLATLLGIELPEYLHVPLAVNTAGQRLAKRDGAVTMSDLGRHGIDPPGVFAMLAASLGAGDARSPHDLLDRLTPENLHHCQWTVTG